MGAEGDLRSDPGAADGSAVSEVEEVREVEAPDEAERLDAGAAPEPDDAPEGASVTELPARPRPDLARTIEALLFLSPQPVSVADLAEAAEATEGQVAEDDITFVLCQYDPPAQRASGRGNAA